MPGGGQCLIQKSFLRREVARTIFWSSREVWKIFKIKGPILAKNAFPEISAWKN